MPRRLILIAGTLFPLAVHAHSAELSDLQASGRVFQDLDGQTPLPAAALQFEAGSLRFDDPNGALAAAAERPEVDDLTLGEPDGQGARRLSGRLRLGPGDVRQGEQRVSWATLDLDLERAVSTNSQPVFADAGLRGFTLETEALAPGPLSPGAVVIEDLRVTGQTQVRASISVSECPRRSFNS